MTNSVDPDQMPRYEVSDLVLHCLQKYICPQYLGLLRKYCWRQELQRERTYLRTYASNDDSDQPAHFTQSDQISPWAHFGWPRMPCFLMWTKNAVIRLYECAGWI